MWIVGNDHVAGTVSPPLGPPTANTSPTTTVPPHVPVHQSATTPHIAIQQSSPIATTAPGLMMGRLSGVVSLTDILNLFARVEGLKPANPNEARMNRRRSSSSSTATSTSTTTERRR
jgi:hypothetical protein